MPPCPMGKAHVHPHAFYPKHLGLINITQAGLLARILLLGLPVPVLIAIRVRQ